VGFRAPTLEGLVTQTSFSWSGRSVLVTGHTGFKGGWLSVWMHQLGARVHGYALEPPTTPNLFEAAGVEALLASDTRADVADLKRFTEAVSHARPEIVFHLAAQPLVRESYKDPVGTFTTNAIGTAHLLEAIRQADGVRAVVVVTSDKVYDNHESDYRYVEGDPLGGRDPYSASKASAEIVAASYRSSFFGAKGGNDARIATARAGNVIGGGDWARGRLVPDCLRAFDMGQPVRLRHPQAVRPWQHVLEPLAGYIRLAERLAAPEGQTFARAWNFGPDPSDELTVGDVADLAAHLWGEGARVEHAAHADEPPEAGVLRLDSGQARAKLPWVPRWDLRNALEQTLIWHRAWKDGGQMLDATRSQIASYAAAV